MQPSTDELKARIAVLEEHVTILREALLHVKGSIRGAVLGDGTLDLTIVKEALERTQAQAPDPG
jgi:hypothetical protein